VKGKVYYSLIASLIILVLALILYILSKLNILSLPSFEQAKVFIFIFLILLLVIGLVLGTYYLFRKSTKNDTSSPIELPKKFVPSGRSIKVWVQEFIIQTNIPYKVIDQDNIEPIRPDAVIIRNETSHPDESMQTPDKYISFEAIVIEGNRPGIKTISFRTDLGEEYIRANWNEWIRDGKSMNLITAINFDKIPKTSAKEFRERMIMRQFEMEDEDIPREEAKRIIDAFIQDDKHVKPIIQQPIPDPSMSGQVQLVYPEGDDDEHSDSIQDDIENYRKSRK